MASRERVAVAIFVLGTALAAMWAYPGIHETLTLLDSGGLGAWSTGLGDLLIYALPLVIAFWLSRRVRGRGPAATWARRAHLVTTLALLAITIAFNTALLTGTFTHGVDGFWRGAFIADMLVGALWLPVQGFFIATFVAVLVARA